MHSSLHRNKHLRYIAIWPDDYDPAVSYPLVIMLHGFGANMQDLMFLAPAISSSAYIYLCPNGPLSFNRGLGMVGFGWTPPRGEATPGDLVKAENLLAGFFDEMFHELNASPGEAILLGFSQGGAMAYRCGLSRPETFCGLVALSASAPDPEELKHRLPSRRDQPIFAAHGRFDRPESLERAQATQRFLRQEGYQPEYREYNMGHEIPAAVLMDLSPWVAKVLPPRPTP
ncbi:MAG TPA: alpha/beta fold hydrolase [Dehalococcoidia bacterium]|nr:alpha/beta fold hydrolase [Dehalococcoidia bacterium]